MSADTNLRGFLLACRLHVVATPLALTIAAGTVSADTRVAGSALHGIAEVVQLHTDMLPASQTTFAVDDIEAVAGRETPIGITMPRPAELASGDVPPSAFILIRNIPTGVRLSAGMANGRLWVVPLQDAAGLRLIAEPGLAGKFTLEFNLIGANNKRLAQQNVSLNLLSSDSAGKVAATRTLTMQEGFARGQDAQPPPSAGPRPSREETVLLERGEELVRQGGLAAARIIFEELARKGSTKGALALARSFDPAYMPDRRVSAVGPDMNKALEWYRRAEEMGSAEAKARLAEINSRR